MMQGSANLFGDLMSLVNFIIVPYWLPIVFICGILFGMLVIQRLISTVSKDSQIDPLPTDDELFTDEI